MQEERHESMKEKKEKRQNKSALSIGNLHKRKKQTNKIRIVLVK